MRVENHPVLGKPSQPIDTYIYVDGSQIPAIAGETIASAMTAAGLRVFRYTPKHNHPRGMYCGVGRCGDCEMIVDGVPNTKVCVTEVKEGMRVETQRGLGDFTHITAEGEA